MVPVRKKDKYSQEIYDLVSKKGLRDKVLLPGMNERVDDQSTVCLRKEAALYVFPSLKEGFSLTPLESMVHSIPCVISKIPCHEEVYGDSAVYFDPLDVNDIAQKMHIGLTDQKLREDLISRGRVLLGKYSFTETAKITSQVFKDVL